MHNAHDRKPSTSPRCLLIVSSYQKTSWQRQCARRVYVLTATCILEKTHLYASKHFSLGEPELVGTMALHAHCKDDLVKMIRDAGRKLIIIDFYASWCGPCKLIGPHVNELSEEFKDVVFIKVDIDECEDLAEEYQVTAMPTFVFLRESKKLDLLVGAKKENLKEKILKYEAEAES